MLLVSMSASAGVYRQRDIQSRDPANIAIIEDKPCRDSQCLIIIKIDGRRRGIGWFTRYELKPGIRTIEFSFAGKDTRRAASIISSTSNVLVEFEAKAGSIYLIRAILDQDNMKWRPEIIEKASGEVIGRPLEPNNPAK